MTIRLRYGMFKQKSLSKMIVFRDKNVAENDYLPKQFYGTNFFYLNIFFSNQIDINENFDAIM